jgi:hypothetical protein
VTTGDPPRDLTALLLVWIGRHGVATVENLSVRFALSERSVVHALRSACGSGLVRRIGAIEDDSALFALTGGGLRAAGLTQLRVCPVAPRAERHLRTVACAAAWLECRLSPSCEVLNERELHLGAGRILRENSVRAASPYVHHAAGARKRPDLLIRPISPADGLPVAVEVELSRKSATFLYAICMAWKHCQGVAGILYLAAPCVLDALAHAIERSGAEPKITVLALAESDAPVLRRTVRRSSPALFT